MDFAFARLMLGGRQSEYRPDRFGVPEAGGQVDSGAAGQGTLEASSFRCSFNTSCFLFWPIVILYLSRRNGELGGIVAAISVVSLSFFLLRL